MDFHLRISAICHEKQRKYSGYIQAGFEKIFNLVYWEISLWKINCLLEVCTVKIYKSRRRRREKERRRANDGNNNSQATHGARMAHASHLGQYGMEASCTLCFLFFD